MREKRWFPILYMFIVTAVFSSVVIGFTEVTRQRVEANNALAFERAVVGVLPALQGPNKMTSLAVHRKFTEQVSEPDETSGGAYTLKADGEIQGYALPISGQGFWAPIKGVIGVKADKKTITGVVFYEQNETPGLGAEIAEPAFRNQFQNKVLAPGDRPMAIKRPGDELDSSEVHAVTGATQTSTRLEKIINDSVTAWRGAMAEKGQQE